MNRYAKVYADIESDERWIAIGLAWCQTAAVPIGSSHLRLIADSGCDVNLFSLN